LCSHSPGGGGGGGGNGGGGEDCETKQRVFN